MDPFENKAEIAESKDPEVWNKKGNIHFQNGEHEQAISAYNKAIELDHSFGWPYSNLAQTYLSMGKYAEATQAVVSLLNLEGYISIEVQDNGKGFELDSIGATSHGITGMRHRVEAAGGRLTVVSKPGNGTRITAVLPKTH